MGKKTTRLEDEKLPVKSHTPPAKKLTDQLIPDSEELFARLPQRFQRKGSAAKALESRKT